MRTAAWLYRLTAPREITADGGGLTVLCAGDSNTFGLWMWDQDTWPAVLEASLRDAGDTQARAVNIGMAGMNTWAVREAIESTGDKYKPDVVAVLAGVNNIWSHPRRPSFTDRLRIVRLIRLLRDRDGRDADGHHPVKAQTRAGDWLRFVNVGKPPTLEEAAAGVRRDLGAMATWAAERGARSVFITYGSETGHYAVINEAIRAAAGDAGALLVDASDWFRRARSQDPGLTLVFPDDHPTAVGYGLIGRAVHAALGRAGMARKPGSGPLDGLAAVPPPTLTAVRDGDRVRFHVESMRGDFWRILVSRGDQGALAWGTALPLAADATWEATYAHPGLSGEMGFREGDGMGIGDPAVLVSDLHHGDPADGPLRVVVCAVMVPHIPADSGFTAQDVLARPGAPFGIGAVVGVSEPVLLD